MTKPMPTVEQLVEVFRANNWKPYTGNRGIDEISSGRCCAIPAALALHYPVENLSALQRSEIYRLMSDTFGPDSLYLWRGFDSTFMITDAEKWCSKVEFGWFKLGYDLQERLRQ